MDDQSNASERTAGSSNQTSAPLPQGNEATPLQRVGVLVEIPRVLREMGVDPDPLLDELGEFRSALFDIDGKIPFPLATDLALACIKATKRSDFPIIVGGEARLKHLGVIGQLLTAAPDFGSALMDFVTNHPRYVRGASTYLVDLGEDGILLGHRVHSPGLRGSTAFSAGAIAFGRAVFAELCGAEPARVLLSLPQPEDLSSYKRVFGRTKLAFEAEHFGMIYSRAALSRPIPTADPVRHVEIREFVANQWNFLQPDLSDRVMRVLVPSVLAGAPSLTSTAKLLAMHPRALNRGLQAKGLSFRDAQNQARFEMASQLLRDTHLGISDLSRILGYSEVSAFTRFFSAMAGLSPSEWKQQQLG